MDRRINLLIIGRNRFNHKSRMLNFIVNTVARAR